MNHRYFRVAGSEKEPDLPLEQVQLPRVIHHHEEEPFMGDTGLGDGQSEGRPVQIAPADRSGVSGQRGIQERGRHSEWRADGIKSGREL